MTDPLDEFLDGQYGKLNGRGDKPEPLIFTDMLAWDLAPLPQRQWWLENLFPLRQPSLVSGEGAIGKSILLLQLLSSTSLSLPWLDIHMPEPGPTIYLGAEDEEDEIRRRLAAILAYHKRSFSDLIKGGFKMLAGAGKNVVLAEFDRSGRIVPTSVFEQLYEAARKLRPKGIVIDTVSDVFLGQEIDRAQVRQFGGLLRKMAIECDCGIIIASHPSLTGIKSGTGTSGSTQWHNSVRARAYFRRPNDEDGIGPDDGRRELEFQKNQYGPVSRTLSLQWHQGLWLPIVVGAGDKYDVKALFLRLLVRSVEDGRNVSPNKSSTYAPSQFAQHPEAKAARIPSKALADAMEELLADKLIVISNVGSPSRPRSYLTLASERPK